MNKKRLAITLIVVTPLIFLAILLLLVMNGYLALKPTL
tara:strand:+ start:1929 stop:2042 length:114 start_codon:yes stop_codon:yes gene_type:complete